MYQLFKTSGGTARENQSPKNQKAPQIYVISGTLFSNRKYWDFLRYSLKAANIPRINVKT